MKRRPPANLHDYLIFAEEIDIKPLDSTLF